MPGLEKGPETSQYHLSGKKIVFGYCTTSCLFARLWLYRLGKAQVSEVRRPPERGPLAAKGVENAAPVEVSSAWVVLMAHDGFSRCHEVRFLLSGG
jgi:hypothetical protein